MLQLKKWKTSQFLSVTLAVTCLSVGVAELALLTDTISLHQFEMLYKTSLSLIFSILLTFVSLIAIKNLTGKKVKTLWRIPFIGFFAGLYFELNYVNIICVAYFGISLIILFRDFRKFRYLLKKFLWVTPSLVALFFVEMHQMLLLNIVVLWLVITGYNIATIANVSSLFRKEVESGR